MSTMSVSLGVHAMPSVRAALEHAGANPEHDPIVFMTVFDGVSVPPGRSISWTCRACWPDGQQQDVVDEGGDQVPASHVALTAPPPPPEPVDLVDESHGVVATRRPDREEDGDD
jgi:hypothetical protein